MKNIKIKLASNYQTIEFEIDDLNEDLSDAIALVNRLGSEVDNSDDKTKKGVKKEIKASEPEKKATEKQIEILKQFKVKNPENYTMKGAWIKIKELKGR